MATSSISADVSAANSQLAEFLQRQEEQETILEIGKRKPKVAKQERLTGGNARWTVDPVWDSPTPMVDRPRTIAGATSFHFSYISISKQGVPTHQGEPVAGSFGRPRNAALDYSKYIEREGAAEVSRGADHAGYIARDGAAEILDPLALMSEAVEQTITAVINETPTAEEAELLGLVDLVPEGIPSVFSNISDDPFARQEFWRAVERCEREPKSHQIILDPEINEVWWAELPITLELDDGFKAHALKVAEAYRQHMAAPVPEGQTRKPFNALPMTCSAEKAGAFITQARRVPGYKESNPPLEFKSGRGGRIQFRMVAELPHELTAEDRALIAQNFCKHLSELEERRDLEGNLHKVGMMYTAVIHAPDAHNDSRNIHLHIVGYDRPCEFLPAHGQWDFEVAERFNRKGEDRIRYPYRQPKLEGITRIPAGQEAKAKTIGINFVRGLRGKFAEIANLVLAARGVPRKLDPRTYTEMGIDRTPTEHLGTKAAALEAIGVPTTVGKLNALAIWNDAERAIKRQATQAGKSLKATQGELDALSKAMGQVDPTHALNANLRRLMTERARLMENIAEEREAIMVFDHNEAKATSRAVRTRQTCLKFLADIEAGRADLNTRLMRPRIEHRWSEAQGHISKIDAVLTPHRAALERAARNIEQREARIRAIDEELTPLREVLEGRVAELKGLPRKAKESPSQLQNGAAPAATTEGTATRPTIPQAGPSEPAANAAASPLPQAPATTPRRGADPIDADKKTKASKASATNVETPLTEVPITEPPSISGLPIVEPTIAPAHQRAVSDAEATTGTPEGLEPLRHGEIVTPATREPETILSDIDHPERGIAPDPAERALRLPKASQAESTELIKDPSDQVSATPEQPATAPTADKLAVLTSAEPIDASSQPLEKSSSEPLAPAEPTVDRPEDEVDTVLLDLPTQKSPTKPETSEAAFANFDNLIKRIMDERVPITSEKQQDGKLSYLVPSLGQADQDFLAQPRFVRRTQARLEAIMETQKQEVQRTIRWVHTQGQNAGFLILENRSARLGSAVSDSVRNLFKHWRGHGDVTAALRAEFERRIELAKAEEQAKVSAQTRPGETPKEREARQREAERIYPDPFDATAPEVKEFTRLLRMLADESELRAAVDKIHDSPAARDEINKHSVYLAMKYTELSHEAAEDRLLMNYGKRRGIEM